MHNINKPTILINKKQVLKNLQKIKIKADSHKTILRPHFKTHQSKEVGSWFRHFGINKITVSSYDMALYFAQDGWDDITIAVPVNPLQIYKINELTKHINLNLLVDSKKVVQLLQKHITKSTNIWIKIDVGYNRVGILWNDFDKILTVTKKIISSDNLNFAGLLTHSGHTYNASSKQEIQKIHNQSLKRLSDIKANLLKNKINDFQISIGDTPSCSISNNFEGIDEIRPGNFVFYDIMQHTLGSCATDEIAVKVACPVIGKYTNRNQLVIYGGAVHLSKDSIVDKDGNRVFGYAVNNNLETFQKNMPLISLSQEHGIIQANAKILNKIEPGDLVYIYPIHSCLTCNLHSIYKTLEGNIIETINS